MTFSPHVRTRAVRYHENAARLFAHLGGTVADDAVLLESADIASKEGLHSVMVLRGSVRVTCNHNDVTAEPLTPSGVAIVQRLAEQLSSDVSRETSEESCSARRCTIATPDGVSGSAVTSLWLHVTRTEPRNTMTECRPSFEAISALSRSTASSATVPPK